MMMSKPQEEAQEEAKDGVADLERRLASLGGDDATTPSFAAPPQAAAAAPPAAATGKNALLARIQAAQARARQANPHPEPQQAPSADLLDMGAPPTISNASAPPAVMDDPALKWNSSPAAPAPAPAQEEPPAFDMLGEAFDSKPAATEAPAADSTFDLLGGGAPTVPPPMTETEEAPRQQTQEEIEEEILAGLEGLSDAEKKALLEEQKKIMAEIERNKVAAGPAAAPLSAADAFDQRSNAAVARIAGGDNPRVKLPGKEPPRTVKLGDNQEVALHGQERTQAAIKDGTAILTKCTNCNNWMQVTDNASLMFCPVCQVVSPVDRENAVATKEEALQMEADRKLAEELQKEEYTTADRERAERRQRRAQQQQQQAAAKQGDSWWDWIGLGGGDTTGATQQRPPGAAGQTVSYNGEDRRLLGNPNGAAVAGGARIAEAKPLFACIADSVNLAASSLTGTYNAGNLTTDEEGNMNGVDGSSLLR